MCTVMWTRTFTYPHGHTLESHPRTNLCSSLNPLTPILHCHFPLSTLLFPLIPVQVTGRVRIDYRKPEQGCGQQIMDCIFEEKADLVVVQRRADVDTSLELVNEAQCAVVLC